MGLNISFGVPDKGIAMAGNVGPDIPAIVLNEDSFILNNLAMKKLNILFKKGERPQVAFLFDDSCDKLVLINAEYARIPDTLKRSVYRNGKFQESKTHSLIYGMLSSKNSPPYYLELNSSPIKEAMYVEL